MTRAYIVLFVLQFEALREAGAVGISHMHIHGAIHLLKSADNHIA